MDLQTPTTSIPTPSATTTTAAAATTTTTTTATSQSTEPSPAQPPQQKLTAALPPSTTSQPPPSIPSSSSSAAPSPTSVPNPNPNPNSNQPVRPIISTSLSQPQSQSHTATRPQTFTRTTWNHPHPHSHFSHFSPISSPSPSLPASSAPPLSSSASPSISVPQQRGGVAIGVPAPHPSPSPAAFSSSFGQPFGGLSRTTVNVPESVANTNNLQLRQGMQGMGMVGSMSSASHIRPGGIPAHHQQRPVPSSIRPPTSSPNNQSPTAQNFQGHGFMRPSSVVPSGSPAPNTSQNMQSPSQPWLASGSQSKPPLPSSSYRPQTNSPSLQQRSHIPQQHHSLPATSQQQHVSSAQPQQPLPSHQPPEHYGQQFPPSRVPRSITQQLSLQGPANLKPSSLAMVQPNTVQPGTQSKTANAESDESGNRILSKRSIHELVSQIDPSEKLDPEVEDILADIADEFVESITTFGCSLAKHRKSDTLEAKDILLHLERNWNMTLPGFSGDEIKTYRKPLTSDIHKERLAVIKKSILASEMGNVKSSVGQAAGNSKSNLTKTPANAIVPPNLKTREVT